MFFHYTVDIADAASSTVIDLLIFNSEKRFVVFLLSKSVKCRVIQKSSLYFAIFCVIIGIDNSQFVVYVVYTNAFGVI